MPESIYTEVFPNGLTLLAEPMDWLESAAYTLLVPAGCCFDPRGKLGLANLTCEMMQRGAGDRDSRRFLDDQENLGIDFHANVSLHHASVSAGMLAENLLPALGFAADCVRRPLLPADQLEDARQCALQDLRALQDDLPQQLFRELRKRQYPDPWGRSTSGEWADVESITLEDVRRFQAANFGPRGAILSVAGKLDWAALRAGVEQLFGDWQGPPERVLEETPVAGRYFHLANPSTQSHLAVAYAAVPYRDPDYYQAWGAMSVLGGGMSSRLFTEVREHRGLCYSVSAGYNTLRDRGSVRCYADPPADKAQETLDVLLAEIRRLAQGIEQSELDRIQARIRTALVRQNESSRARSGVNAGDWYHLERVQPVDEVARKVAALTAESINAHLAAHPPGDFLIVTLGPEPLQT